MFDEQEWLTIWVAFFLSSVFYWLSEISYVRITDIVPQWRGKRHFNIWSLYRLSLPFFGRERIVKFWRSCRGPGSFNSSFNFTSSAHLLTLLKQSHLLFASSHSMKWELFLNTRHCKYFKYLNFNRWTLLTWPTWTLGHARTWSAEIKMDIFDFWV